MTAPAVAIPDPAGRSKPTADRDARIDACRGALIVLMCSTHALTLSGVARDHWLWTSWLPRGWATHGFVIVSGIALSVIFGTRLTPERLRWTRRRAVQLVVIAIASNVFLSCISEVLGGRSAALADWFWWRRHVLFGEPYSISAVLFPTAALVGALPTLAQVVTRLGRHLALAAAIVLVVLSGYLSSWEYDSAPLRQVIAPGLGGFPLLRFFCEGVLGYAAATWALRASRLQVWSALACALAIAVVTPARATAIAGLQAFSRVSWLGVITALGLSWPPARRALRPLCVIGRFPLFAFIAHRIVLRAFAVATLALAPSAIVVYWSSFVGTILSLLLLCTVRLERPRWDSALKRVGL